MNSLAHYVGEFTHRSSTALLMWDYQVGLAGRACRLQDILRVGNRLLEAADEVGIPVFWSRHTLPPVEDTPPGMLLFQSIKQGVPSASQLTPFMQTGSPEREFLPEFAPRQYDIVIEKSTPSFFVGTDLSDTLTARGIQSVVIAGVAAEIGVDLTAKHALALGFVSVVIEDAVSSYTEEKLEKGLAAMRTWIPVITSEEIIAIWSEERT